MCNKIIALFVGFFLLSTHVFGQFRDVNEIAVDNNEIVDPMYRTGRVGIGFANFNAYNNIVGANPPRLLVRDGILGHHVSDTVGNFSGKWCGLGIGNPGGGAGAPKPYGLAIADTGSVGFYNIIREVFEGATRKNTVAGFGAEGSNINRFIVRAYSGTNAATGKDLLVANPEGGIGVNAEPQSSLWVDATGTNLDSLFRAIVIRGSQPLPSSSSTRTVTAIGTQANNSLAGNGIAEEGLRASFRNNKNTDPFAAGNKLPVMTFQANGRVGIGTLQPTSGTCAPTKQTILLDVNGLIRAGGALVTSDRRFKQDIETIPNSLELIRKMRGATYTFNQSAFPDRNFSGGKQYGFIAQEVADVIPELAVLNSDGYFALNYTMLIPVLTEAVKEQDAVIEQQKAVNAAQATEIARLNAEMQQLRNMVLEMKSAQNPADLRGYRLEQNTPNPFGNTTQIRYALPEGTAGASINVYDLNGRLLRAYPLTAIEGAITINGADYPNGAYLYDLLVGGRQVDVKRMVLSKM